MKRRLCRSFTLNPSAPQTSTLPLSSTHALIIANTNMLMLRTRSSELTPIREEETGINSSLSARINPMASPSTPPSAYHNTLQPKGALVPRRSITRKPPPSIAFPTIAMKEARAAPSAGSSHASTSAIRLDSGYDSTTESSATPERKEASLVPKPSPTLSQSSSTGSELDQHAAKEAFSKGKILYERAENCDHSARQGLTHAIELYKQAYTVFSTVESNSKLKRVKKKTAWKIAILCADLGYRTAKIFEFALALKSFLEAQQIFLKLNEISKEANCLLQISYIQITRKQTTSAADYLRQACTKFVVSKEIGFEAICLCELGNLYAKTDPQTSIFYFKQALIIWCKLGDTKREAFSLFTIAKLNSTLKDFRVAFGYYKQAKKLFLNLGKNYEKFAGECFYELGKLATKAQHFTTAVNYFEQASGLYRGLNLAEDEAWCLYRLGLIMIKCKDAQTAVDYLTDAKTLFERLKKQNFVGSCLFRIGEILSETDPEQAKLCLNQALDLVGPSHEKGRRTTLCLKELEKIESSPVILGSDGNTKAWWSNV